MALRITKEKSHIPSKKPCAIKMGELICGEDEKIKISHYQTITFMTESRACKKIPADKWWRK
jgi:hypothetical protein